MPSVDPVDQNIARTAFSTFIREANKVAVTEPRWFSVRGTSCSDALCLYTFLDPRRLALMLYTCGLVTVTNGTNVKVREEAWRNWLREEGLQPTNSSGISEFTKCKVEVKYLVDESCRGSEARRLDAYFLRIGEYKERGEAIKPTDQLRAELSPPLVNLELRRVQRRLAQELIEVYRKYNRFEDVDAVEAWIKWSVIDEEALILKQMEGQIEDNDISSEESDSEVEESDKDAAVGLGLQPSNTNNSTTTTLISTPSTVNVSNAVVFKVVLTKCLQDPSSSVELMPKTSGCG
jgi:hypothetical protein